MRVPFKDELVRLAIRQVGKIQTWLYYQQSVPLWHSSDGSVRPISDMDDTHLHNAINRLRREYPSDDYRQPALTFLLAEAAARRKDRQRSRKPQRRRFD